MSEEIILIEEDDKGWALPLFVGIHVYSIGWMSYIRPTKEQNNHNIKLNKGVREVWIW